MLASVGQLLLGVLSGADASVKARFGWQTEPGMPGSWCFEGWTSLQIYKCCSIHGRYSTECWDEKFTYEQCCLGKNGRGDDEAGLTRSDLIAYFASHTVPALKNFMKSDGLRLMPFLALGLHRGEVYAPGRVHYLGHGIFGVEPEELSSVVVDVGAHHGETTAEVLRWMPHKGDWPCNRQRCLSAVVAVEPAPSVYHDKLMPYASKHGWSDAGFCALNVALSNSPRLAANFTQHGSDLQDYLVDEGVEMENTTAVNVTTLEALFTEQHCGLGLHLRVYLLKIDAEGQDLAILEGAKRLLHPQRVKFIIFEFGEFKDKSKTLRRTLSELWNHGYGCFLVMDHFLVPMSEMWYYTGYERNSQGGYLNNVDVFCGHPHDPDLFAVVDGFSSSSSVHMARDASIRAVEEWRHTASNMLKTDFLRTSQLQRVNSSSAPELRNVELEGMNQGRFFVDAYRKRNGRSSPGEQRLQALASYKKALQLETARANLLGRVEAAFQIATCYHFADCAEKNYAKAKQYYEEAARLGHTLAWDLSRLLPAAFWL